MPYIDKHKMRAAARARQQRRRDRIKAKGVTSMAEQRAGRVDPIEAIINYGQSDCQCMHCQSKRVNGSTNIINHGSYKTAAELGEHEINRVSLPGDPDYDGVCLDAKYDDRRISQTG